MHSADKLMIKQVVKLETLAKKRRQGIPMAYILGYKYFYGLRFKVSKSVLIPRPETEWLVDKALQHIDQQKKRKIKIIDIGTGSGCIAVSIAKHRNPNRVSITAVDISEKALQVAKYNAQHHNVRITFKQQDLLSNSKSRFDIIIANLPYVPISDYKRLYDNLKHEPKLALTDGTDNAILVLRLLEQLPTHLQEDGVALLEIDPSFVPIIKIWLKKNMPRMKVDFIKDIHKLNRYCIIRLHSPNLGK